jgi:hypothetical protein
MKNKLLFTKLTCLFLLFNVILMAQEVDDATIRQRINNYKEDLRGPFQIIKWFCDDGSIIGAREDCPEPGGVQHALRKPEVRQLDRTNHIFFGQILTGMSRNSFWDADNNHSQAKQYSLEQYLRAIDDGWILRKAQFYRGAFQIEDEKEWGQEFLMWLVRQDVSLEQDFFLMRQMVKDIPHENDNDLAQRIRAISKYIAEEYPSFEDIRVKIHGQPSAADFRVVTRFEKENLSKLDSNLQSKITELKTNLEIFYQPVDLSALRKGFKYLNEKYSIRQSLENYVDNFENVENGTSRVMATAELLYEIRQEINSVTWQKGRLALMDISLALEGVFFKEIQSWNPQTAAGMLDKICYSGMAATGTGFIENWEWNELVTDLSTPNVEEVPLSYLNNSLGRARNMVEWGTNMPHAIYQDVVELYEGFEPKVLGFYDDRIRGSVLLSLGNTVGQFGDFVAKESNFSNQLMDVSNAGNARGLNPGYAMGELVVVSGSPESVEVENSKIYIFNRPPADLKPLAGIATVTEGNMVSHVQLLARNLAIPNAVISGDNLDDLKRYAGQKVFYAVSNRGTVLMKLAVDMTDIEKELFSKKERNTERITVPIDKIDFSQKNVVNMADINSTASGVICGPKAANLGQLKQLFPENVVEGLVIPFGVFRAHLNQNVTVHDFSYWTMLDDIFAEAKRMEDAGKSADEVEDFQLCELDNMRYAISQIKLMPKLVRELKVGFKDVFGNKIGRVPVFLRSDTNMEDLEDFTGAGLNLTKFNVVDEAKIIEGIKEVWASPYKERSFKWRQRYLNNPENVFPSILIIPSVDVDNSGVLITKGITTGSDIDLTIAFSRGAGGAVDGQAAESYLLKGTGEDLLLSPAREALHRRLPVTGGSMFEAATYEEPILNKFNLYDLKIMARDVQKKMKDSPGVTSDGPWDIELGFKDDKIWLFQIRPFVENKRATSSVYLESISPKVEDGKMVSLK